MDSDSVCFGIYFVAFIAAQAAFVIYILRSIFRRADAMAQGQRRALAVFAPLYFGSLGLYLVYLVARYKYPAGTWEALVAARGPAYLGLLLLLAALFLGILPWRTRQFRGLAAAFASLWFLLLTFMCVGLMPCITDKAEAELLSSRVVGFSLDAIREVLDEWSTNDTGSFPESLQDTPEGRRCEALLRLRGHVGSQERRLHYVPGLRRDESPPKVLVYEWFEMPFTFIGEDRPEWAKHQVLFTDLKVRLMTREELTARLRDQGLAPPKPEEKRGSR